MAGALPLPPNGTPFIDPRTGTVAVVWQNYMNALSNAIVLDAAPRDGQYWVSTANPDLTNERNIGLLASGYLKITTALGVATPSSTATIPAADLAAGGTFPAINGSALTALNGSAVTSGVIGLARGGTNADLSATGGTSQVLKQSSVGATVTVGQLATTDISGLTTGTYTPTLTSVANVTASTPRVTGYYRIADRVTVFGALDLDPTSALTLTQLGISLPVASNFANAFECGGTAAASAVAGYSAAMAADAANDRAELAFTTATDVANQTWNFSFTYQVI